MKSDSSKMDTETWDVGFQNEKTFSDNSHYLIVCDRMKNETKHSTQSEENKKETNHISSSQISPINTNQQKRNGSLRMILN
jgi:hypothetical protein